MFTENIALRIYDIPWLLLDLLLEEVLHRYLADEAESLRILSFCVWESGFFGYLSYFGLL